MHAVDYCFIQKNLVSWLRVGGALGNRTGDEGFLTPIILEALIIARLFLLANRFYRYRISHQFSRMGNLFASMISRAVTAFENRRPYTLLSS